MLYAQRIKENQQKSKEIKKKPITDLEQWPWSLSDLSDDFQAPTMGPIDSGGPNDTEDDRNSPCRGRRWPEMLLPLVGSLETGFRTQ